MTSIVRGSVLASDAGATFDQPSGRVSWMPHARAASPVAATAADATSAATATVAVTSRTMCRPRFVTVTNGTRDGRAWEEQPAQTSIFLDRPLPDGPGRRYAPKWALSASRPPWKTWLAKNPTQCSCLSRSQSNVVHHSTKAVPPSVTGDTLIVAS